MAESSNSEVRKPSPAIARLEEDHKRDPDKHAIALARAYLDEGQAREADRILARATRTVEALILHAQARFDLFDNGGAKSLLGEARKLGNLDDDKRAQLLLGQIAFDAGDKDKAKEHLHEVRKLDPDNRRVAVLLHALGESVPVPAGAGDDDAIISYARTAEERETPKKAFTQVGIVAGVLVLLLGAYAWQARRAHQAKGLAQDGKPLLEAADVGSLRKAIVLFDEALAIQGSNEAALAGRAYAYTLLWYDHGIAEAKDAALAAVSEAVDDKVQRGERYAAEALVALAQGQPADAEATLSAVLERGGMSDVVFWTLGLAQRAQGKRKAGRDNLRRAQDSAMLAPHFAMSVGDAYDDEGEASAAAGSWSTAASSNPKYLPGAGRDLIARVRRGEGQQKIDATLTSLEATPPEELGPKDTAALLLARSEYFQRLGQPAEALTAVERALALVGDWPMALTLRGRLLIGAGKVDEGLATKKLALAKSLGANRYFYELVEDYSAAKQPKAALALLQTKAGELSQDPVYQVTRGRVLVAAGDFAEAKAAFGKALEMREDHPDALYGMGVWAWRQKKYDEARDWFQKAIGGRSRFPEVFEAIGLMWIEQGAVTEGNQQLEEADKQYRASAVDAARMRRFYEAVTKAVAGRSSLASAWAAREKVYREGI